jgi:rhodanese-related sulfurtransferase
VKSIDRQELKARLDRGDDLKLVMTLPEAEFNLKHIPGSIRCYAPSEAPAVLQPEDDIVVYCSCPECPASATAARLLEQHGFTNVLHYRGGIVDWEEGGYPLEGAWARNRCPTAADRKG